MVLRLVYLVKVVALVVLSQAYVMPTFAQKLETAIWYFGQAGLDFRQTPISAATSPRQYLLPLPFDREMALCPALIGDSTGAPQAFACGSSFFGTGIPAIVYDAQGDSAFDPEGVSQNSMFLPMQGRSGNWYYLNAVTRIVGIRMGYVGRELKIISPNPDPMQPNGYFDAYPTRISVNEMNSFAVAKHADGNSYWILAPNYRQPAQVLSFLIDTALANRAEREQNQLSIEPVTYTRPRLHPFDTIRRPSWARQDTILWFHTYVSPDSRTLCIASLNSLMLWRINRSTGKIYDSLYVPMPYSRVACFSPDSRLLYCPSADTLFQLDLSVWDAAAIRRSRIAVGRLPSCPAPEGCETPWATLSDAKVAVNGKIYLHIAHWRPRLNGQPGLDRDWPTALSVIHCPDVRGVNCGFELDGQTLFGKKANSMLPVHDQTQVSDAFRLQVLAAKRQICAGDTTNVWAFGAGAERFAWQIRSGPVGWQTQTSLAADTGSIARFSSRLAGVYTLAVRGISRCSMKDTSIRIEVQALPIARAIADTLFCPPQHSAPRLSFSTTQAGVVYSWQRLSGTPAGLLSDTSDLGAMLNLPRADTVSQRFTYVLTARTIALGCIARDTVSLRLGPDVATYRAGGDVSGCQGDTLRLGLQGPQIFSYFWTGALTLAPVSAQTILALTDTGAVTNQVMTLIRRVSAEGCESADTVRVQAHPLPPPISLSGPGYVCPGSSAVPFQLLAATQQGGRWSYRVQVLGGDSVGLDVTGPGVAAIVRIGWQNAPIEGRVSVNVLSPFGCLRQTAPLPVSVTRKLHPKFDLETGVNTGLCLDPSQRLSYTALDTVAGRSYTWSITRGSPDTASVSTVITGFSSAGLQPIRLFERERTPAANCEGDTTLYATLYPVPSVARIPGPDTVCVGVESAFPIQVDSAAWTWQAQGQGALTLSPDREQVSVVSNEAFTDVSFTVRTQNAFGCLGSIAEKRLFVQSLPTPSIVPLEEPLTGDKIAQTIIFRAQGRSRSFFEWQIAGGTVVAGQGTAEIQAQLFADALRYSAAIVETDRTGCVSTVASLTLPYDSTLVLPNVITPNGDGKNETFTMANLRFYPGCRLEIYDRWGRQVFIDNDYSGTFSGVQLPAGTYMYRLIQANLKERKGWLEIVK